MTMQMRWADASGLDRQIKALQSLGSRKTRIVGNRVANRAGDQSRTQVRRELTKQTGLPRKTIVKAVKVTRSTPDTLAYRMRSQGGDVSLKYFSAREQRRGVKAKPFGQWNVFPSTFIKGGRFPNRVDIGKGGHVFQRTSARRKPIEKVKSGVIIPEQMVKDATAEAFRSTSSRVLITRMAHELSRMTNGAFS